MVKSEILSFPVIAIGHFRFGPSLCFKARLSAKLLITIYFFILKPVKLIFSRKVFSLGVVLKVRVLVTRKNGLLFNIPNIQ